MLYSYTVRNDYFLFFQAEDGIRDVAVTGVQTCALPIYIMQSNGGIAASVTMEKFPVHMVESGPAAGAQLSAYFGKTLNMENLLSFEMGGTTAKICPIVKGEPKITDEFEIEKIKLRNGSGLPINIPAIDMIEIGAGGGSIARVNMGLLI